MNAERPVLFNGAMVRAILEGRKTQTRRLVKNAPAGAASAGVIVSSTDKDSEGEWWWLDSADLMDAGVIGDAFRCPYGQPGDRLWVRETFAHWQSPDLFSGRPVPDTAFAAGRPMLRPPAGEPAPFEKWERVWSEDTKPTGVKWTPSIHMPRSVCRLVLEVTDVRVERLQDINQEDAEAEGSHDFWGKETPWKNHFAPVPVHGFAALWESVNGAGAWAANPWVWAISFKRVD